MAHIPFFELTAENAEASQMIHVVNRLIAAINRVIADLPEPKVEHPPQEAAHPAAANQKGTHR